MQNMEIYESNTWRAEYWKFVIWDIADYWNLDILHSEILYFSIDITDIKNFIFDITQNIDIYRFQIEGINISVLFWRADITIFIFGTMQNMENQI